MLSRLFLLCMLCASFSMSANFNPESPAGEITLEFNADGSLATATYPQTWTNGNINQFYLDGGHTYKIFDNIRLAPGTYDWTLRTIRRNNRKGKVNFTIQNEFKGGSSSYKVNETLSSGRTHTGSLTVYHYNTNRSGPIADFAQLRIKVGRNGINTNCNYQVTLTRRGNIADEDPCNYDRLGYKSGNIIGNTTSKVKSTRPACRNNATVTIEKTGGKARTTVNIYRSSTVNGTGTLVTSYEFANGNSRPTRQFAIPNANGRYIRVELRNRSAANTFKYKTTISQ